MFFNVIIMKKKKYSVIICMVTKKSIVLLILTLKMNEMPYIERRNIKHMTYCSLLCEKRNGLIHSSPLSANITLTLGTRLCESHLK